MDEDFYIEETSPVKVILGIIIFIGIIAGGLYYYLNHKNSMTLKLKNVTFELGSPLSKDITTYIESNNPNAYTIDLSNVSVDENGNVNSTGEYSYHVKKVGESKKGKIFVKDTTNPEVTVEDLTVGLNEEFGPIEFVTKCEDLSLPCTARYKNIKNEELNTKEGEYDVDIIISDAEGNEVTKKVKLTVSSSTTLAAKKESDLTFDHLSEQDDSWDKSFTLKLEKALADGTARFDEVLEEVSTKEYNFDKEVVEKKILVAYNKYDYAIGFSIKVKFSDDTVKYITSENASEKIEQSTESTNE